MNLWNLITGISECLLNGSIIYCHCIDGTTCHQRRHQLQKINFPCWTSGIDDSFPCNWRITNFLIFFLPDREVYSFKDNCWKLWCTSSSFFSSLCQATIVKQCVESDVPRFWGSLESASCNWGDWRKTRQNRMS